MSSELVHVPASVRLWLLFDCIYLSNNQCNCLVKGLRPTNNFFFLTSKNYLDEINKINYLLIPVQSVHETWHCPGGTSTDFPGENS